MVLVGPSGCGKSTLLRMIAGLEAVSGGTIRIGDRDVTEIAPRSRDVAMVFQNYALYPNMRVWDNLAFALKLRRTPKPAMREQVGAVAGVLGLERAGRPQAGRALRRPAAARRDRARDGARAAGVPDGRAALQPRRQAARRDARGAGTPARPARRHHRLRHPRPGRGDDARRPGGGAARRHGAAVRRARAAVRGAGERLRRGVHGLAGDEPRAGRGARGPAAHGGHRGAGEPSRPPSSRRPGDRRRAADRPQAGRGSGPPAAAREARGGRAARGREPPDLRGRLAEAVGRGGRGGRRGDRGERRDAARRRQPRALHRSGRGAAALRAGRDRGVHGPARRAAPVRRRRPARRCAEPARLSGHGYAGTSRAGRCSRCAAASSA